MRAFRRCILVALLASQVGCASKGSDAAAGDSTNIAVANVAPPSGWQVASDSVQAARSVQAFGEMPPGWHLNPAPGGVIYDPSHTQSENGRVTSEFFLFSPAPGAGFGVILGGAELDTPAARYTAFVVGPDGRYRVTRREGGVSRDLVPWTAHPAIARHPGGEANVKNAVTIVTNDATVVFEVNGTQLTSLPRTTVQPDGIVGLRVDHSANVHAATFVIGDRNVAPTVPPTPARASDTAR